MAPVHSSRVSSAAAAVAVVAMGALPDAGSALTMSASPTSAVTGKFSPFATRALATVSAHPIVQHNPYCTWFAKGDATIEDVRDLVQQFSVFSNLFLLAQLSKVINAPTLDEMREGKEILANEIGVVFKAGGARGKQSSAGFDPALVSTVGSVEGGVYRHRAAHFEWLCEVGASVGLEFSQLGKRRHGSPATLHFCDQLYRIYGSELLSVSLGASFAIEHWANAGFWDQLVEGFERLNTKVGDVLPAKAPLGFWKFHQALEAQHASHTMDELEAAYAAGRITDEAAFSAAATEILDSCAVFWGGLDATRKGQQFQIGSCEQTVGKYGI